MQECAQRSCARADVRSCAQENFCTRNVIGVVPTEPYHCTAAQSQCDLRVVLRLLDHDFEACVAHQSVQPFLRHLMAEHALLLVPSLLLHSQGLALNPCLTLKIHQVFPLLPPDLTAASLSLQTRVYLPTHAVGVDYVWRKRQRPTGQDSAAAKHVLLIVVSLH